MKERIATCKYCGIEFPQIGGRQYCSVACRTIGKKGKNTNKPTPDCVCVACGGVFIRTSNSQKYCSAECAKTYRNVFIIYKRDNFRCIYCGRSSIEDEIKLHIDHIFPRAYGGENTARNLVTSCASCNTSKSNVPLNEDDEIRIRDVVDKRDIRYKLAPTTIIHF